ncbi:MAG: prepilin-type N-terminal cleavage/methylation domain-containing protein [Verrucomicrobiota bacterium]
MKNIKVIQSSYRHNNSGFTLVEMLVVITIIGIIAVLAIPSIGLVQSKANHAATSNKLRQLGVLVNVYLGDNDMRLPYIEHNELPGEDEPGSDWHGWEDELMRATGTWSVHQRAELFHDPSGKPIPIRSDYTYGAFSCSLYVFGRKDDPWDMHQNKRPLQIEGASRQIMIFTGSQLTAREDEHKNKAWSSAAYPWLNNSLPDPDGYIPFLDSDENNGGHISYRLGGKAGCLMIDGTVEFIPKGKITYAHWHPYVP